MTSQVDANLKEPFRVYCKQYHAGVTSTATDAEVLAFAKTAFVSYKERFGKLLQVRPILRMDIFKNQSGRLVINELECLEANIKPSHDRTLKKESSINMFLVKYWCDVIKACIEKCQK